MKPEQWRWIPGWEGLYKVSDWGRVKSMPRRTPERLYPGKVLSPGLIPRGYALVNLSRDGKINANYIHRLVLLAFKGPPPDEHRIEGCHKDGDPTNNRPSNLYWGTSVENAADRKRFSGPGLVLADHQHYVEELPPVDLPLDETKFAGKSCL